MSNPVLGIIGVALVLLLTLFGMRVAFALAFLGIVGIVAVRDWPTALAQIGLIPFRAGSSYTLSTIPVFMLMGHFAYQAGIADMAFRAAQRVLGPIRGGLGMATMLGCAAFAATSGSSVANSAIMTRIALPEMRKHQYEAKLAAGIVAIGGTLGTLIPPSTTMIIYGAFTNTSISALFLAGIVPGIMMVTLYSFTIWLLVTLKPQRIGAQPVGLISPQELPGVVRDLLPVTGIFLVVMGTIYGGVATPTEAAIVGCVFCFLFLVARRQLSWQVVKDAFLETGGATGMIFAILLGGFLFSSFLALSGLPGFVIGQMNQLQLPPYGILTLMLIILATMGMFIEPMAIMLITLPLFMPIIRQLGFDPVWFGIQMVMLMEMSMITPPLGLNVYVVHGMVRDVSLEDVFRGVLPLMLTMAFGIVLVVAFPQLSLWLPSLAQ